MKTYFLKSLVLIIVTLSLLSCQQKQTQQQKKPNIIMFLVDDMGWKDIGCNGSDFYQTPNIDQMAKQGMRFTNAYSACTVCSPTRASLMTGEYPARLHITDWIAGHVKPYAKMQIPDWQKYLPLEEYTIAEAFHDNGYTTAHIGKWHLGDDKKYWPQHQGFDINIGGWSAGSPTANGGGGYFSPYHNPELTDGPKGEYLTERLANEACNFIEKNKNGSKPFFLNFWLYNVHLPLQAKTDKIDKFSKLVNSNAHQTNPVYAAQVAHVDDALGRVMAELKKANIDDNTIVIFYSDNGGIVGNFENDRKRVTNNYPLRSGKGDIYEGGVRVPLIVRWPGKVKEGAVCDQPVISVDMYPTMLSLTSNKLDVTKKPILDGVDLKNLLLNNTPLQKRALYWHYPHYHLEGAKPYSAIRYDNWKLIQVFEDSSLQLYDLSKDIGEQNNLYKKYPQKADELLRMLDSWRKKVNAQLPIKNPNYNSAKEQEWKISKSATITGKNER